MKELKQIKEDLFKRNYLLVGYFNSGIKLYKIWDIDKAKLIYEDLNLKEIKELILVTQIKESQIK